MEKQAELERTVGRIASGAGKRGKGRRRLTRQERKQIEAVIRQARGDGKNHTVQASLPFRNMHPDGLCRLDDRHFSKTIAYADVSYRLAGPEDQRDIFERLCDFYNGYDPSIGVQMTLSSSHKAGGGDLFRMAAQGDDLDGIRAEASGILQTQYERGSNGYVKSKYVTLTIEAENLPAARARFSRIEADTLNRFKVMGAAAKVLDGKERLALLHGLLHPRGEPFAFEWDWLPASGLSVKDFIAPSSFEFGETRRFRMGEMYGAVSFLQILAPEIQDRNAEGMDMRGPRYTLTGSITVNSTKVDQVRRLMAAQKELIGEGVPVTTDKWNTVFLYTKLNTVKPAMVEEATKNAREVAQKFAADSGSHIGKIKSANQGQFSITDANQSTPYEKKVRVVTTVTYFLKD